MTGKVSMCESCWKRETHVIVWCYKEILALVALECFAMGGMRTRRGKEEKETDFADRHAVSCER